MAPYWEGHVSGVLTAYRILLQKDGRTALEMWRQQSRPGPGPAETIDQVLQASLGSRRPSLF